MRLTKKHISIGSIVVVAGLCLVGYAFLHRQPSLAGAISADIRQRAGFTIYVPSKLPDGYTLQKDNGVSLSGGVLFMELTKDDQTIFVSQQQKPNPSPALSTLSGFKSLDVSAGSAVIGEQEGSAAAIVVTKNSLITIASDGTVSGADLGLVAKRLQPIN